MGVVLEIPGGESRVDPTLCHPPMRGDPGIRALLVQAGSLETGWGWCTDSSERNKGTEGGVYMCVEEEGQDCKEVHNKGE